MTQSNRAPGPDADAAFTLGLAASLVLSVLTIGLSFWSGNVTLLDAGILLVLGLPAVVVVASCLLAVWLGYDRDAVDAFKLTEGLGETDEGS